MVHVTGPPVNGLGIIEHSFGNVIEPGLVVSNQVALALSSGLQKRTDSLSLSRTLNARRRNSCQPFFFWTEAEEEGGRCNGKADETEERIQFREPASAGTFQADHLCDKFLQSTIFSYSRHLPAQSWPTPSSALVHTTITLNQLRGPTCPPPAAPPASCCLLCASTSKSS